MKDGKKLTKFLIIGDNQTDCTSLLFKLIDSNFVTDRQKQVLWMTKIEFYINYHDKLKECEQWCPDVILFTKKVHMDKVIKMSEELLNLLNAKKEKVVKCVAVGIYCNGHDTQQAKILLAKKSIDLIEKEEEKQIVFYLNQTNPFII